MMLVGPFHLKIFWDSVILWVDHLLDKKNGCIGPFKELVNNSWSQVESDE